MKIYFNFCSQFSAASHKLNNLIGHVKIEKKTELNKYIYLQKKNKFRTMREKSIKNGYMCMGDKDFKY